MNISVFVAAKGDHLGDAARRRRLPAKIKHRIIAVQDSDAACFQAVKNLAFGRCDRLQAFKMANVHSFNIGNQGNVWAGETRERGNFAGMVHAHFQDTKVTIGRRPR